MFFHKMVFIFLLIGSSMHLQGKTTSTFKSFDVRSAMVSYEIKGDGNLTENSHLTINGRSALIFDEWGARKLYKEKYLESTTGAVKNTKTIRTFYVEDHGKVHKVNFEKQKIETSEDPVTKIAITSGKNLYQKALEEMLKNGKRVGESTVLGYPCDEWIFKGKKRCYSKGIPLREESTVSGIAVSKTATSIRFDINISNDAFDLPDFRLGDQKGFLMKESKEKLSKKSPVIQKATDDIRPEIEEIPKNEESEIEVSADLTQKMFQEQKDWLPKLLSEMQEARVCLENALKASDANNCLFKLVEIEEKMSGEKSKERLVTRWTELTGQKIMDELEEGILDMKRRMPCIRRSHNFDDLSKCMQDPE